MIRVESPVDFKAEEMFEKGLVKLDFPGEEMESTLLLGDTETTGKEDQNWTVKLHKTVGQKILRC